MRRGGVAGLLAAAGLLGLAPAEAVAVGAVAGAGGYRVTVLPALGGSSSAAYSVNDRGWVAGRSNLPGDTRRHAVLWRHRMRTDLGTLGGPNSSVAWPVKDTHGIVSGIAQTERRDPLGERWSCAAFFPTATGSGRQCLGFRWQAGVMRPLPTLGGTNGFATATNNAGQTVGWAENRRHDPTCAPPQVLQFRAVRWGPDRRPHPLPPLPGDTVSAATAINDRGQVVGISGFCDQAVGRFSAVHAVRWEHGRVLPLGSLGGVAWNTPMAINSAGDVAGFGNTAAADGGDFQPHAFLWTHRDGLRDLGVLPGDRTSQALGINTRRDIVGTSCDTDNNCRAFLWRRGRMVDLNTLVTRHDLRLLSANDINDTGTISGQAARPATGDYVAFSAARR